MVKTNRRRYICLSGAVALGGCLGLVAGSGEVRIRQLVVENALDEPVDVTATVSRAGSPVYETTVSLAAVDDGQGRSRKLVVESGGVASRYECEFEATVEERTLEATFDPALPRNDTDETQCLDLFVLVLPESGLEVYPRLRDAC